MIKGKVTFDEEAWARIKAIQEHIGGKTPAEVIRNALGMYEWALETRDKGYEFYAVQGPFEHPAQVKQFWPR